MPLNPVDAYVGNRLKIRRNELGISQTKISEMVGITFQQVQKYEKGLNRIGSSRLYEFSKILKVPVSYFFDGYEISSNCVDNILKDERNSKIEKEIVLLVDYFYKLKNPLLRKSVISLLKNILPDAEG